MPNINSFLGQYVRKLARRELMPMLSEAKKRTAEHRRSIAQLKRQITALTREVSQLKRLSPKKEPLGDAVQPGQKLRLRVDGLKRHRQRLGLSAKDFGTLLGVSSLTVYNWEAGKPKPRRKQLPRIAQVRALGKREALEALRLMKID